MRHENGTVNTTHPGYGNMRDFFMNRSPGAYGVMVGKHGELELPTPVFSDSLRAGLTKEDADSLLYLYGRVADFMGARNVQVIFNREGWPIIRTDGDVFPNTKVYLDMSFLVNARMAWTGDVFSDRLILNRWLHDAELEKIANDNGGVEVYSSGVYAEHADVPEIAAQFPRYPDLAEVMRELQSRDKDPVVRAIEGITETWEGNWDVYSRIPPTLNQKTILERYQSYRYMAEVHCFVSTLDEIIDEIKIKVPAVQEAYFAARDKFVSEQQI